MEETEVATIDDEPWWAGVSLNHIAKLRMGVFETGRWMRIDGVHEELVKIGGLELGVAGGVDLGGKFENLRHVFAGDGAR